MNITILTPSYNYARFIDDTVASIREQKTTATVNAIVQDAGSKDNTSDVVAQTAGSLDLSFFSERDSGQSDALNRALARSADADVIGWLNADEFYLEGALEVVRQTFESNPKAAIVYGDCAFVDEGGRLLRLVPAHRFSNFVLRHYGCFISSCATFISADALRRVGWDDRFRRAMDWDLWLSLQHSGEAVYIPHVLSAFRVHGAQVTNVPESADAPEFDLLRSKHHIRPRRVSTVLARIMHIGLKAVDGSYIRQMRFNTRQGMEMMWWK